MHNTFMPQHAKVNGVKATCVLPGFLTLMDQDDDDDDGLLD